MSQNSTSGVHDMNIFKPLMTLKSLCKQWICFQQYLPTTIKAHDDILKADSVEWLVLPGLITKWFAG